jgi:excinuclease ABC subunit C
MNKINLKSFPLSPGVYLFKDYRNRVIYVGRATYLRKRIANYFSKRVDSKTAQMVSEAKKLDFVKTDNLIDAVILEANLIKKHWPKYNIREKDNRSFIYIVIPKKEWSYPIVVRGQQLNKYLSAVASAKADPPQEAHIFGPFKSFALAKNLLLLLRKIFPWSTCSPRSEISLLRGKLNQRRPCFYQQIGLCPGKCTGEINAKEYQKIINNLILLFKGKKDIIKRILRKEKPEKLKYLKRLDDSILITASNSDESKPIGRIEGYDISHFAGRETVGSMVVFQDNEFDKTQYRLFKIRTARPNDDLEAIEETISRRLKHNEWKYPGLILIDGGKTQVRTVEKVLKGHRLNIPVAGIAKPPRVSSINSLSPRHPEQSEGSHRHRWDSSPLAQNDSYRDKLVFGKMQKSLKDLISLSFPQLLKIRNEAHRFANSLRKKLLKKSIKTLP